MKTKQRFVCPKHGSQCEVVFNPAGGGRFHSCRTCYDAGDKYTVEGEDPFKAYGNIAQEFGHYGLPQTIQTFPTVFEERKMTLKNEYIHFLCSVSPQEENDYRLMKKSIELYVHPLGGKYRKASLDDVRFDLDTLRKHGTLP